MIANAISSGAVMRIVFSVISSTLTAPITALTAAVIYFRLRGTDDVAVAPEAQEVPPPPAGEVPPPPPPPASPAV